MPPMLASVQALCRSRQVALTTVAAKDREYCDRLQTSLVRGHHELLYWGSGPSLRRGDLVVLYTPKSRYLPSSEHSCVRRLYFAAADSTPGRRWKQDVFLHRRVALDRPISHKVLTEDCGLPFRHIVNAGRRSEPLTDAVATKLLLHIAKDSAKDFARLRELAQVATASPEICISYSGLEWTQAQRVKLWLDLAGMSPFFVSPVGDVLPGEVKPLTALLTQMFSRTSVAVFLIPHRRRLSRWIRLEMSAAVGNASRVLFVRFGPRRRPWPHLLRGRNIRRVPVPYTRERDLVATVAKELRAARRLTRAST